MLKKGLKVFYLLFIANIMSFFLIISFNFITTIVFTEQIGYYVYGATEQNTEQELLYTHYYKDGEDTKQQEYIDKGYTLNTPAMRSQPSKTVDTVSKSLAGVICIFMAAALIYNDLNKFGDKHRTSVKYEGKKQNLLTGFGVGLIATGPAIILLAVLTILKTTYAKSLSLLFYGLLNTYIYDFLVLIANGANKFGDLSYLQIFIIFLLLLIVPVICGISYILGYKSVSLSEKLIYKKN